MATAKASSAALAPRLYKPAERIEGASERKWIRVSEILIDPTVQRTLRKSWAQQIAHEFDPDRVRVIVVSHRADRKYYVIDGQHRIAALKLMGYGDQLVDCAVFDRTHMADAEVRREDAKLFLALNRVLSQKPIESFLRKITAEEPIESAIGRIVTQCGLTIAPGGHAGAIASVAALTKIYTGAGTGRNTPEALTRTLETIIKAWGREAINFNGKILSGLGLVFIRYGKQLDHDALVKRLSMVTGGAAGLIGSAGTLYSIRHTDINKCMASVIVDVYNKGRRDKLESWWR